MKLLGLSALVAAAFAGQAQTAFAENISVRLKVSQDRAGVVLTPVRAERGDFALTPGMPADARDAKWRIVARNAQGKVMHEVLVRDGRKRHVEVFNPRTGAIDLAQSIAQANGVFEVSLPFDAGIETIDVLPQAAAAAKSAAAPLARFKRAQLEQVAGASKLARSQAATPGAAVPVATMVVKSGPSNKRMDYVFVGDGYTAAEMGKWQADAKKVIDGFMADPLFAANRGKMNVHRVDVASNESGADESDRGIYRDTAMDGAFNCYNIDRLLCVDPDKVYDVVGSVLAPDKRDVIVVISNSTRYGGSGGAMATLSMHAQSTEVALHEIGHTAFALADEYEYGSCDLSYEPAEANVSLEATRAVKWSSLIAAATPVPTSLGTYPAGTVGIFQGAQYCTSGKYRPTENSRMRTLGHPWHAVNEGLANAVFEKYQSRLAREVTQTGTVAAGETAYVPEAAPGTVLAGPGKFTVKLSGAAGTDFNLGLYKWVGSDWARVAESIGPGSKEAIRYEGTSGWYYVQVEPVSGSGSYSVTYAFPPK